MTTRVFCLGNPGAADDAAGELAAQVLESLGVPCERVGGDVLALLDRFAGAPYVILVDAMTSGAAPGTVRVFDGPPFPFAGAKFAFSTHGFGVRELLGLAEQLGRLPERVRVYGIEGASFEAGAPPSAEVREAAARVAAEIAAGK